MGACAVSEIGYGTSAGEAFDKIVEDCIYEYGDDSYNGTFSTCSLQRVHRLFSVYKKGNEEKAREYLRKMNIGKRDAHAVDLGVKYYEVRKARFVKGKGNFKAMFCVNNKVFSTLAKAKEYALSYAKQTRNEVVVTKKYVNQNGDDGLGYVDMSVKQYTKMPKRIPSNATVKEIHAYYFFGWAAE